MGTAALSAVHWLENFSGSKRETERKRSVDGCVPALCSITALTDTKKEGNSRERRRETGGNEVV